MSRLSNHIDLSNLNEPLQSGFKWSHSIKTDLLNVTNPLCHAANQVQSSILILFGLSCALNTINHLQRLHTFIGLLDTNLNWFRSYLFDGAQAHTMPVSIKHGVLQGSVLRPLSFCIYFLSLEFYFDVLVSLFIYMRTYTKNQTKNWGTLGSFLAIISRCRNLAPSSL